MRIAVTPLCNLHCYFCRPEGEGISGKSVDALSRVEISLLVSAAAQIGFTNIKFTGGEPLLRKDILDIILDTSACEGVTEVQMVTNGTLLAKHAVEMKEAGLSSLTLSLDATTPETFMSIRGGDINMVLQGLEAARSAGLSVRINSVITKRNLHEIFGLIEVARRFRTSLKLLDLINLTAPEGDQEWINDFVPFKDVRAILENLGAIYKGLEPTPGGIGAPLLTFQLPDGLKVVIKDSMFGLYFSPSCSSCKKYPCQDAIISLRVTHDGQLKKCLARNDNLVNIREFLCESKRNALRSSLDDIFTDMVASKFVEGAWKPPLQNESWS